MFIRNSKKVRRLLLAIFFLSSCLGIVLLLLSSYGISSVIASQASPDEVVKFSSPAVRGFGILGDSNSDEYRSDDHRGGAYEATTLNWMEQLVLKRGLNFGPWGKWGEPRRKGYEYNWARTGATTADMIASGQHTGLAQQVAKGEVSHVIVWIGGNDFAFWNNTYQDIYRGKLSEAEIEAKIEGMLTNITTAVDTVLAAGEVKMVITTIPDKGIATSEMADFPKAEKRQRVSEVIDRVNAGIKRLAEARGIAVVDAAEIATTLYTKINQEGALEVGGVAIKMTGKGNDPHYLRLEDGVGHAGTVGSGLMANQFFVEPFNRYYGLGVTPLSDKEILEAAGLTPGPDWAKYLAAVFLLTALVSVFALSRQDQFPS